MAGTHGYEAFRSDIFRGDSTGQVDCRLLEALVRQLECSPMTTQSGPGVEKLKRLHSFFRIQVLVFHEPARRIGADRKQGQVYPSCVQCRLFEGAAIAKAGVASEVDDVVTEAECEGAP